MAFDTADNTRNGDGNSSSQNEDPTEQTAIEEASVIRLLRVLVAAAAPTADVMQHDAQPAGEPQLMADLTVEEAGCLLWDMSASRAVARVMLRHQALEALEVVIARELLIAQGADGGGVPPAAPDATPPYAAARADAVVSVSSLSGSPLSGGGGRQLTQTQIQNALRILEICLGTLANLIVTQPAAAVAASSRVELVALLLSPPRDAGAGADGGALDGDGGSAGGALYIDYPRVLSELFRFCSLALRCQGASAWLEALSSPATLRRVMWVAAATADPQLFARCLDMLVALLHAAAAAATTTAATATTVGPQENAVHNEVAADLAAQAQPVAGPGPAATNLAAAHVPAPAPVPGAGPGTGAGAGGGAGTGAGSGFSLASCLVGCGLLELVHSVLRQALKACLPAEEKYGGEAAEVLRTPVRDIASVARRGARSRAGGLPGLHQREGDVIAAAMATAATADVDSPGTPPAAAAVAAAAAWRAGGGTAALSSMESAASGPTPAGGDSAVRGGYMGAGEAVACGPGGGPGRAGAITAVAAALDARGGGGGGGGGGAGGEDAAEEGSLAAAGRAEAEAEAEAEADAALLAAAAMTGPVPLSDEAVDAALRLVEELVVALGAEGGLPGRDSAASAEPPGPQQQQQEQPALGPSGAEVILQLYDRRGLRPGLMRLLLSLLRYQYDSLQILEGLLVVLVDMGPAVQEAVAAAPPADAAAVAARLVEVLQDSGYNPADGEPSSVVQLQQGAWYLLAASLRGILVAAAAAAAAATSTAANSAAVAEPAAALPGAVAPDAAAATAAAVQWMAQWPSLAAVLSSVQELPRPEGCSGYTRACCVAGLRLVELLPQAAAEGGAGGGRGGGGAVREGVTSMGSRSRGANGHERGGEEAGDEAALGEAAGRVRGLLHNLLNALDGGGRL